MYKGANAIANLITSETNLIKATGGLGSGFVPEEKDPFEKEVPQYAIDGMIDCSFCLVEAAVRPDAPSVNNLVACGYCLKQESTVHFRRQLAVQGNAKQLPAKSSKITESQQEILDYLKENGGQATIGANFADTKQRTVKRLIQLEELRLIENVQRPVYQNDFPLERRGKLTPEELHCGIWKLKAAGRKVAA
jgi:hypothetical protein